MIFNVAAIPKGKMTDTQQMKSQHAGNKEADTGVKSDPRRNKKNALLIQEVLSLHSH